MNKSTIIIKGVRAAKFSIKTIQGFLFLNGLVSIYNFNKVNNVPNGRSKITIKPRHTKFKYPIGFSYRNLKIIYAGLYIYNNKILKMYVLEKYVFAHNQTEITKWINQQ